MRRLPAVAEGRRHGIVSAHSATETLHELKISWSNPYFERGGTRDGLSVGTGRKGKYHWVIKDGLHAAYHYPHGVKTPIVLVSPQSSARRAYQACVDHNKAVSNRATTSGPSSYPGWAGSLYGKTCSKCAHGRLISTHVRLRKRC